MSFQMQFCSILINHPINEFGHPCRDKFFKKKTKCLGVFYGSASRLKLNREANFQSNFKNWDREQSLLSINALLLDFRFKLIDNIY